MRSCTSEEVDPLKKMSFPNVQLFHVLFLPGICYLAQIIIFQCSGQTPSPSCSLSSALTSQHRMTAFVGPPLPECPCVALLCQSVHVSLSTHLTGLRRPALHTSHPAHMTCGMLMEGRDSPLVTLNYFSLEARRPWKF